MRLLIVGNLNDHISKATQIAHSKGAIIQFVDTVQKALDYIKKGEKTDLILIDAYLEVKYFISALKSDYFDIPVLAYGIKNDANAAVKSIKAGAKEYLALPSADFMATILNLVTDKFNRTVDKKEEFIFQSPAICALIDLADKFAASQAGVLITGESGTGKEVMARYIHLKSLRAKENFVSINCAAIPENLLESELFGHEKGSFTGAMTRRIGKFEEAHQGTLLLDEISEMHPRLQAKLLRAIQEKEIDRVGGSKPIVVDIRLIATSNRDLLKEVEKGTFREDLFFRLNIIHLHLPPLRERKEDILPLANYFIGKYTKENTLVNKKLSAQAKQLLTDHYWQGNIRELQNTIYRAVLLSQERDIIEVSHLNLYPAFPQTKTSFSIKEKKSSQQTFFVGQTVANVEKQLILNTLDHCLGNRTKAATILGISIRTLRNKLNQYHADKKYIPYKECEQNI